jgi:RHS repeat-associated protein
LTQENNNNGTVNYSYNDVGLRTNMTVTGETAVFYRYDNANRLTNVTQGTFTSSLFYDDAGRRTKFTAREDDGTGLYYYRARYFHPPLGRFVSEDPLGYLGGDVDLYAYVGGMPLSFTDPLGLSIGSWYGGLLTPCEWRDLRREYNRNAWRGFLLCHFASTSIVSMEMVGGSIADVPGTAGVASCGAGWWIGSSVGYYAARLGEHLSGKCCP